MAHFAKIGLNNEIISVEVVDNNDLLDSNNNEVESIGIDFLTQLCGWAIWKQTSYNGTFRKNYAGIGYTYDPTRDAFIAPQPFNSWTLNEDTCQWESPTPYPDDDKDYTWDEDITNWVAAVE